MSPYPPAPILQPNCNCLAQFDYLYNICAFNASPNLPDLTPLSWVPQSQNLAVYTYSCLFSFKSTPKDPSPSTTTRTPVDYFHYCSHWHANCHCIPGRHAPKLGATPQNTDCALRLRLNYCMLGKTWWAGRRGITPRWGGFALTRVSRQGQTPIFWIDSWKKMNFVLTYLI